jgi:hypothetical protein
MGCIVDSAASGTNLPDIITNACLKPPKIRGMYPTETLCSPDQHFPLLLLPPLVHELVREFKWACHFSLGVLFAPSPQKRPGAWIPSFRFQLAPSPLTTLAICTHAPSLLGLWSVQVACKMVSHLSIITRVSLSTVSIKERLADVL